MSEPYSKTGRLSRAIATRAARVLLIAAIDITGALLRARAVARRAPWWARYARARRHPAPGPGRDDGEELTRAEIQVLGNLAAGRDVRSRT